MKLYSPALLAMALAGPALCQWQSNINDKEMTQLDAQLALVRAQLDRVNLSFLQAPFQATQSPFSPARLKGAAYDAGTRALDQHRYDEAVKQFDIVIAAKSDRAEGALYWKAYALNRAGKSDEALAAIAQLRSEYTKSAWLSDAQALEAEVRQNAGHPVSPAQESNDDLKLLAINSLMNADPNRAIPLLEGVLKGPGAPQVKNRALFVLSQSESPRARQALVDYAKSGGNPDLQLGAIQYLGMSGTKEAQQQLVSIYSASGDSRVKSAVLYSLLTAGAIDALLNIAKTEKDAALRNLAIRNVVFGNIAPAAADATRTGLLLLYSSSDSQAKREIIDGMMARGDAKALIELVRKETDPAMKKVIVERLGAMPNNKEAMDYMTELLK